MSVVSSANSLDWYEVLPALVHSQGLALVHPQGLAHSHCTQYRYDNKDLNLSGIMWECNTKVSFQTEWSVSPWHGKFSYYHHHRSGMITILFNCKGDDRKLKSAMLLKTGDKKWTGFDYQGRVIHLTRIGNMKYDEATQLWSEVVVA